MTGKIEYWKTLFCGKEFISVEKKASYLHSGRIFFDRKNCFLSGIDRFKFEKISVQTNFVQR